MTFSASIFASIFSPIFDRKWLPKTSGEMSVLSPFGLPFSRPFPKVDFLMHFGRPLAHFSFLFSELPFLTTHGCITECDLTSKGRFRAESATTIETIPEILKLGLRDRPELPEGQKITSMTSQSQSQENETATFSLFALLFSAILDNKSLRILKNGKVLYI